MNIGLCGQCTQTNRFLCFSTNTNQYLTTFVNSRKRFLFVLNPLIHHRSSNFDDLFVENLLSQLVQFEIDKRVNIYT